MSKNSLSGKIRLISKFMTSQPGSKTLKIHIMRNILRSKGTQAMKFGRFIQLAFIVCKIADYQNILEISFRPPPFTLYKAFFF